jgi:hypothetical protein
VSMRPAMLGTCLTGNSVVSVAPVVQGCMLLVPALAIPQRFAAEPEDAASARRGNCMYVFGLKTSVLPTSIWHSQMCQ